jgi:hypothetical protein
LHARRENTREKNRRAEAPLGDTEWKPNVDALEAAAGLVLPQPPADRTASASPSGAALSQQPEDLPSPLPQSGSVLPQLPEKGSVLG